MIITKKYTIHCFLLTLFIICTYPLSAESESEEEGTLVSDEIVSAEAVEQNEEIAVLNEDAPSPYDDLDFYDDLDNYLLFEAKDLVMATPVFEPRSFREIYPNLTASQRRRVMSAAGLRNAFESSGTPILLPASDSGINLLNSVMQKNPSHVVEALILIPYTDRELDMLDIYNALGRIQQIKNQTIPQSNGNVLNVFKETTRLDSAASRKAIADPSPSNNLPFSETIFLRFTDAYIGNLFLRGDISLSYYGLTYNMTNFRDVNYSIFRVMGTEKITIILYLEPVTEGILVYSMSGLYLPSFISKRLNLTVNINNRITVLVNWITEGLRNQEVLAVQRDINALREGLIKNDNFSRLLNN
ncbi:MAG: hypothetical protein FWB86_00970 [Treponema sp.]|nr:hypothetical protein [Treponema sp.]MCL2250670.1 hypothetical protein [Treponema sp.]